MSASASQYALESTETVHGTCVAVERRAALLVGPSGAGKSDLALRCLGLAPCGLLPASFTLVADDRVTLEARGQRLLATCPHAIRGRLEVRGVGIFDVASVESAEIVLVVHLNEDNPIDRQPDPSLTASLLGVDVSAMRLRAFEASAPLKLALALLENKP